MECRTLQDLCSQSLKLHHNEIAVIEDTGSSRCVMTYKDLKESTSTVSNVLSELCGGPGCKTQFVTTCMDQCLIFPSIILGILQSGFSFACMDPSWSKEKKLSFTKKLQTSLVIYVKEEEIFNAGANICKVKIFGTVVVFERITIPEPLLLRECPHSLAYAVLTSGSTGEPKMVRVPHSSIVPNIVDLMSICNITASDCVFLSSPSTFDPSVLDMFLALASGASLLITSKAMKTSAAALLHILFPSGDLKCTTIMQMTPSLFNRWSCKEMQEVIFCPQTSLRILLLGGEPPPSILKLERCKGNSNTTRIFNIYGITEVSPWSSIHEVLFSDHTYDTSRGTAIPLGKPLSNTIFQVRDSSTGSEVIEGEGELFIGSSSRICEVGEENCLDFQPPLFRATGDTVKILGDGSIYFVGRKDNSVKRWGHRVNLESVEHIALSHVAVKSACCVWDAFFHKMYLVVVCREEAPVSTLRRHFLQSVGSEPALVPDEILVVDEIDLTTHGKIDRNTILELMDKTKAPQLPLQVTKSFMNICCSILGLQSLPEGSFLHCGGNSLLAMALVTELENTFGSSPEDLASLLLSDLSLQLVQDYLCKFYEGKNKSSYERRHSPAKGESASSVVEVKETMRVLPRETGLLISFCLRGNFNRIHLPYFKTHSPCLENLKMSFLWKVDLKKCVDSSPLCLVYDSGHPVIIIGSHSGDFVSVDGESGEVLWSLTLPARVEESACTSLCGQYVFIGCRNGVLYCINSVTGKIKWSFPIYQGHIKCLPALCNEGRSILFGAYDFKIHCINVESGQEIWSFADGGVGMKRGHWTAAPLVVGEMAVVCSLAGNVHGVRCVDGYVMWTLAKGQPIFSTPCLITIKGVVHVVFAHVLGGVYCLRALTGQEVWGWQAPGQIFAPLSAVTRTDGQHQILASCHDNCLYCLNINSDCEMTLSWKVNLHTSVMTAPFPFSVRAADKSEYIFCIVSNKAGIVFIMSLSEGKIHSQYNLGAEVFSSPIINNDRVYVGCRDNFLYSLKINC